MFRFKPYDKISSCVRNRQKKVRQVLNHGSWYLDLDSTSRCSTNLWGRVLTHIRGRLLPAKPRIWAENITKYCKGKKYHVYRYLIMIWGYSFS